VVAAAPPPRKRQTTKTKKTTHFTAAQLAVKAQVKAKYDRPTIGNNNKKKAPPVVSVSVSVSSTTTSTNKIPTVHQCCSCNTHMQERDVAVTDQFNHRYCFDCIITLVSNNNNATTNAPINLTGTTKTCASCGQEGSLSSEQ